MLLQVRGIRQNPKPLRWGIPATALRFARGLGDTECLCRRRLWSLSSPDSYPTNPIDTKGAFGAGATSSASPGATVQHMELRLGGDVGSVHPDGQGGGICGPTWSAPSVRRPGQENPAGLVFPDGKSDWRGYRGLFSKHRRRV